MVDGPSTSVSTPLIGISVPRSPEESAFGIKDSVLQVMEYSEAIVAAGGRPVLLPATAQIPTDLLQGIDGLVLSGGGDLSPQLFGAEPVEASYGISEIRDAFESALVRDAAARGVPVLAICRGLQLINVLRGGTLHMDIPGHWQDAPSTHTVHSVSIREGSALARIAQSDTMMVNSYHHQAIKDLGAGLTPVAFSDDLIEAFEADDADIIGVQWHPEHLYNSSAQNMALFTDLIQRARLFSE